jgi:pilus assembly protein TadC
MQFLRTLFWVTLAVCAAIFSFNNWSPVTVNLWNGLQLDTRLPLLLGIAFLAGLMPVLLLHRTTRWRMRRKLDSMERALSDIKTTVEPASAPPRAPVPPAAAPIAVPPGVA